MPVAFITRPENRPRYVNGLSEVGEVQAAAERTKRSREQTKADSTMEGTCRLLAVIEETKQADIALTEERVRRRQEVERVVTVADRPRTKFKHYANYQAWISRQSDHGQRRKYEGVERRVVGEERKRSIIKQRVPGTSEIEMESAGESGTNQTRQTDEYEEYWW